MLIAGCEGGAIVQNAATMESEVEREALTIKRTLPENLASDELKRIAKKLEAEDIHHPQLEEMLLELDRLQRARSRANSQRAQVSAEASLEEKLANCGITTPVYIKELGMGAILSPTNIGDATLSDRISRWNKRSVQAAAKTHLDSSVTKILSAGIYNCRTINRDPERALSQHAFGMAVDVTGFELADGRRIMVSDSASLSGAEADFMKTIDQEACQYFTVNLSPYNDDNHASHFHLDIQLGSNGRIRTCA